MLDILRGTPLWVYAIFCGPDLLRRHCVFQESRIEAVIADHTSDIRRNFPGLAGSFTRRCNPDLCLRTGIVDGDLCGNALVLVPERGAERRQSGTERHNQSTDGLLVFFCLALLPGVSVSYPS